MARRKVEEVSLQPTKFAREGSVTVDNFEINSGDIIKIRGEYGVQFKFHSLVTNTETGVQWIDCFEVHRGQVGTYRSFRVDRIKRIPKRRSKVERRRRSSTAS
jgi:hypothetical protein